MPKILETSVEIDAPLNEVWKVFSEFTAYPQWNPFIIQLEGSPIPGDFLKITLLPPGGKKMVFKPVVLKNDPQKEFRWKGKLLVPGIFDGEHYFKIEAIDSNRTKFVQGEVFSGILVPLVKGVLQNTQTGFEAMNTALKSRVEKR